MGSIIGIFSFLFSIPGSLPLGLPVYHVLYLDDGKSPVLAVDQFSPPVPVLASAVSAKRQKVTTPGLDLFPSLQIIDWRTPGMCRDGLFSATRQVVGPHLR